MRKLNVHNLEKNLKNNSLAKNIIVYDELISTQSLAHKLALDGSKEGTIIISNIQTHGIGRYSGTLQAMLSYVRCRERLSRICRKVFRR